MLKMASQKDFVVCGEVSLTELSIPTCPEVCSAYCSGVEIVISAIEPGSVRGVKGNGVR